MCPIYVLASDGKGLPPLSDKVLACDRSLKEDYGLGITAVGLLLDAEQTVLFLEEELRLRNQARYIPLLVQAGLVTATEVDAVEGKLIEVSLTSQGRTIVGILKAGGI
jgi:hypothetical protein